MPWWCRVLAMLLLLAGCGGSDEGGGPAPDAPSDAAGGPAPSAKVWSPPPGTTWQWQLRETIDTSFNVTMYDIDLFDAPQGVIDQLHAQGRIVICYFSAGSYEEWRVDSNQFPRATLGKPLDGWPGERWLDVRDATVRRIQAARMDLAVAKHCDGVEPDNVDGYQNDNGFGLTAADQLDYNRWLAREAHARGLSIGLKNDLGQIPALVGEFDWALNEECFEFSECSSMGPFIQAGKAVFHVEYGPASLAQTVCPSTQPLGFSTLIKNLSLDAWRVACN